MHTYHKWLLPLCWWVWTLVAFIPASDPGWSGLWVVLIPPTCSCLCCAWAWRDGLLRDVWLNGHHSPAILSILPAALLLIVVGGTNFGLTCRVWLCEHELREFAESVRSRKTVASLSGPGKQVGLFFVRGTGGFGTEVNIMTTRCFFQSYGITYWPDGAPNRSAEEYQHLYGPWYRYTDDF